MTKTVREVCKQNGLGDRRYERYVDAFDWITECYNKGFYLEAIAVLDSLINDRLSSRLAYVSGQNIRSNETCGGLCQKLVGTCENERGHEKDPAFRKAITHIGKWVRKRNEAMHATAKILQDEDAQEEFSAILKKHKQDVNDGIKYLQDFDELDTLDRERNGKCSPPASSPYAFFPKKRL